MRKTTKKANPTPKLLAEIKKGLRESKAVDPVILDLSDVGGYCDAVVIASGTSDRQVRSMGDRIMRLVREKLSRRPLGVEGEDLGEWLLLDYGEVVVHLFQEEARFTYNLEDLWSGAKRIPLRVARATKVPAKSSE